MFIFQIILVQIDLMLTVNSKGACFGWFELSTFSAKCQPLQVDCSEDLYFFNRESKLPASSLKWGIFLRFDVSSI